MQRHYFPGGNTSQGFVNLFAGITPPWEEVKRIYVLKGGPGVGKNTFMHRLSERALQKGHDVEYFHCASDAESMDVVRIPAMGLLMLDGTAPHIVDPVTPGAVDGILNLGVYLEEPVLEAQRREIETLMAQNSRGYRHTFAHLAAAGSLQANTDSLYREVMDDSQISAFVKTLFDGVPIASAGKPARERRLFASAFTPQGRRDFMDTVFASPRVYQLKGPTGITSAIVEQVVCAAKSSGMDYELYVSPLLPQKPLHVYLREMNLLLTSNESIERLGSVTVDVSSWLNEAFIRTVQEEINENCQQVAEQLETAIRSLKHTKQNHDEIEALYKQAMDFPALSEYTEAFLDKLFKE